MEVAATRQEVEETAGVASLRRRLLEEAVGAKRKEVARLARATEQGRRLVEEVRRVHVPSVTHRQEVELEAEVQQVEQGWWREKLEAGLELREKRRLVEELEGLVVEREDVVRVRWRVEEEQRERDKQVREKKAELA